MAADSLLDPLRTFTVLRTFLIQLQNLVALVMFGAAKKVDGFGLGGGDVFHTIISNT